MVWNPSATRQQSPLDAMNAGAVQNYALRVLGAMEDKVTDEDTRRDPILQRAADEYARGYSGNFQFMLDMKEEVGRRGVLSIPQARGTLNCMRAQILREQRAGTTYTAPQNVDPYADAERELHNGYYTVVTQDGHTTIRLKDNNFAENMPAATQVVGILTGSENENDYTSVGFVIGRKFRIWKRYNEHHSWKRAIAYLLNPETDPDQAGQMYALESGQCYRCGRLLTTPESIERGIGPKCLEMEG